jgi:hypothetical protein
MRVGLIPPRGLENFALASRFHMALAIPSLIQRRAYGGMYKRVVSMGDYVILDNGAAEGELAPNYALWEMAEALQPSELVVPDAMGECDDTLAAARQFFKGEYVFKTEKYPDMKYMAVVQGRTKADLHRCVDAFVQLPVNTIGIPRHLLASTVVRGTDPKATVRIDLANWIDAHYPGRFEIHLLGTSIEWIGEVRAAAKYASHIRSVDTSLPFNYALQGIPLTSFVEKVSRPKLYFANDWSPNAKVNLVRSNIDVFLTWAGCEPTGAAVG